MQDKEDDGLVGKIFLKEAISGKSEADLRVETCINEDIEEEEILFFGGSIGNTQENLLSNYKDKNTSLKYKDPVPGSYNLNTTKVLDVLIDESKTFFCILYKFDYSNVPQNNKTKRYDFDINTGYHSGVAYLYMLGSSTRISPRGFNNNIKILTVYYHYV